MIGAAALAVILQAGAILAVDSYADSGDGFAEFWPRFRDAVSRNSEAAVRDLTRLPFLYEGEPHGADRFDRVYAALFDAAARECLSKAAPKPEDGMYVVFCGSIIYVFARDPEMKEWKLAEFTADPEQ